jgi:hypothetical protein
MSVYGFDVSNFTTVPDVPTLQAFINSEHLTRILIATQFQNTWNAWHSLAQETGLEIYAWLEVYNPGGTYDQHGKSYAQQVNDNLAWLPTDDIKKYYLAIEDTTGHLPTYSNIVDALNVIPIPHGIYTGAWYWPTIGNPQLGQVTGLWNAGYDNNPENYAVNYGGWLRCEVHQYAGDYTSYGMTVDLDSWSD